MDVKQTELVPGLQEPAVSDTDIQTWREKTAAQRSEVMGQNIGHNALINVGGEVVTAVEAEHMRADGQDIVDPHEAHASR